MEITNPRRILAVSLADSAEHLSRVIKDLTGTFPVPAVDVAGATAPSPPPTTPAQTTSTTSEPPSSKEPPLAQPLPNPPPSTSSTLAGTTHVLPLKTAYYAADVPIWLDLVSSPPEWSASFLSEEAREVLEVLGGVVVVFPLSTGATKGGRNEKKLGEVKELIAHVGRVVKEGLGGVDWDGVGLAVGVSGGGSSLPGEREEEGEEEGDFDAVLDEWEDTCWESGLEFVHHHIATSAALVAAPAAASTTGYDKARNQFGEKMGISRVLEALQANEWSGGGGGEEGASDDDEGPILGGLGGKGGKKQDGDQEENDQDGELDPRNLGFGFDREDFAGLRKAIWRGNHDDDDDDDEEVGDNEVQKLEKMMHKLQAVRDRTAGMPEEQRKRIAKQAVDEVMKEL